MSARRLKHGKTKTPSLADSMYLLKDNPRAHMTRREYRRFRVALKNFNPFDFTWRGLDPAKIKKVDVFKDKLIEEKKSGD